MGLGLFFGGTITSRRLIAALMMSTAIAACSVPFDRSAYAQSAAQTSFYVPAGPLNRALAAYGRQAGLQVTYLTSIGVGKTSPGVSGAATREQALSRILQGTGLTYRFTNSTTVAISQPASAAGGALPAGAIPLDTIDVQGAQRGLSPEYAGGQVATGGQVGILGNRSVMDTPFNQTNYTSKRIQDTQAPTIKDALQDDPSVRATSSGNSTTIDTVNIRGFSVANGDTAYGGLFGLVPYSRIASQIAERVEVLKGPSALLNGMPPVGSIGGTVNLVPKRAGDIPLTQLTTNYMSNATFGGHVDIGRRFGTNNEFGVRFNGVYTGGDTAVDDQSQRFGLAVLGLDYRGERLRLSADLGYQAQRTDNQTTQGYFLAAGLPVPEAPNGRKLASQPWTYSDRKDAFAVVRGEFDVTNDITVYGAYGARKNEQDYLATGFATILNPLVTPAPFGTTSSTAARSGFEFNDTTAQAGVRTKFNTGPIGHRLTIEANRLTRVGEFGQQASPAPIFSNLYNPILNPAPTLSAPKLGRTSELTLSGLAIADTLSFFDERILLTGGVRKQYVDNDLYNFTTNAYTGNYNASALSPAVAIVVKPWANVSLYANYIEGLQAGSVVPASYSNAGTVLPPYQSKQSEAGVKVDWGAFTTTLSAFQIAQPNTTVNVAANTLNADGEQINRGIEFNFFGQVTDNVRLLGGAMFIDPRLTKTQSGIDDGKVANGVPRVQANLGVEWDTPFIRGFTLTGRAVYTGSQYYETALPRRAIPEWTRFDLGARYTFLREGGQPVTIRFSVENVADKNYWAASSTGLIAGAARTYLLSSTFNF